MLAARAAVDSDAFAELYRRYVTAIRRYCGFRLHDWWTIDDLTSEIFVKALESLHKTSVSHVRPWLFSIAHNQIMDRVRRFRDEIDFDSANDISDGKANPEETAIAQGEADELRNAIRQLKPDQARVLELRLSGLDGPEIRQVLNRSRSWVDTTQYRALICLRKMLNPDQSPEVI